MKTSTTAFLLLAVCSYGCAREPQRAVVLDVPAPVAVSQPFVPKSSPKYSAAIDRFRIKEQEAKKMAHEYLFQQYRHKTLNIDISDEPGDVIGDEYYFPKMEKARSDSFCGLFLNGNSGELTIRNVIPSATKK